MSNVKANDKPRSKKIYVVRCGAGGRDILGAFESALHAETSVEASYKDCGLFWGAEAMINGEFFSKTAFERDGTELATIEVHDLFSRVEYL